MKKNKYRITSDEILEKCKNEIERRREEERMESETKAEVMAILKKHEGRSFTEKEILKKANLRYPQYLRLQEWIVPNYNAPGEYIDGCPEKTGFWQEYEWHYYYYKITRSDHIKLCIANEHQLDVDYDVNVIIVNITTNVKL